MTDTCYMPGSSRFGHNFIIFRRLTGSQMKCRPHCGACCISPSISSSIPGMPEGKPAGITCIHLTSDFQCAIFLDPSRPEVCKRFKPEPEICGKSREEAMIILSALEN